MRRIGFIVQPGFQLIGFTAFSVFEIANLLSEPPAYELSVPLRVDLGSGKNWSDAAPAGH